MSETERLLEENIVDYESVKKAAEGYLKENRAELSKRFCYAQKLNLPVREDQAFFLCDAGKPGEELVKLLLEQFGRMQGKKLRLLYYGKGVVRGANRVSYDSKEYWEALACSGYLISNAPLPAAFVKREEQTYFNALSMTYGRKSFDDLEGLSLLTREFLKTDVTLGASVQTVRETWGEKAGLLGIYDGTVLLCENPAAHAREIAEAILKRGRGKAAGTKAESAGADVSVDAKAESAGADVSVDAKAGNAGACASGVKKAGTAAEIAPGLRRFIPENTGKKRILVLTAWKMPAEQTYLVKRILADPALSGFDVTVLSSLADAPELLTDFAALSGDAARVMYRGRMVLTEREALTWRILEKNPDVCVGCPGLAAERNRLIGREWRRIWGAQRFDVCLVLGSLGWQQCHMAMAGDFEKRILVDVDFLENFREKAPMRWNRTVTGFDEICCLTVGKTPGAYGPENKSRVRRLPIFSTLEDTADGLPGSKKSEAGRNRNKIPDSAGTALPGKILQYAGREYVVCGSRKEGGRQRLILLELPAPGSVLGRDGFRVDERFWKYLYFLPAAGRFFARLSGCVRNPTLEYDAVSEICKSRGVAEV